MIADVLIALWFMLPAGTANMAPVFASRLPGLNRLNAPLDGGRTWHGKPVMGRNKTWRGLIAGVIVATITLWLQQQADIHTEWGAAFSAELDYSALPVLLLGPLFGLGALGGDAIKSFFKRRIGIESGKSWLPFDQTDYIIGAIVATLPVVQLTLAQYVWIFILWFGLHLLVSYIGWLLKLKDAPI